MAIHTLTLRMMPLKKRVYTQIRHRLYQLSESGQVPLMGSALPPLVHVRPISGITVKMISKPIRHFELRLNPSLLFGGDYTDLCDLAEKTLVQLEEKVNSFLEIIGANFLFSDMCLSRIDCTQDITLPGMIDTTDMIDVIRRSKTGGGYERDDFSRDYKNYMQKNRHSFRVRCNDISLTVYDKGFQLVEEGIMSREEAPVNRLRFEAAFERSSFRRVMNDHLQATYTDLTTGETILFFSKFSMSLLQKYFGIGIMPGRYLRLDLAKEEIDKSGFSHAIKKEMKKFMVDVRKNYKYGVDGALWDSKFTTSESYYLFKCFQKLNLNPVALPMRCKCSQCPSIQELFEGEIPA